jgi:hypothetical protein
MPILMHGSSFENTEESIPLTVSSIQIPQALPMTSLTPFESFKPLL